MAVHDAIERSIDIDASAATVWDLIKHGGWWINDGEIEDQDRTVDGDLTTIRHAKHGTFRFRTEKSDPPTYIAFRWLDNDDAVGEISTLVEFSLAERTGGVTLTVVESGFLALPEAGRDERFADHAEGWPLELDAARRHVE